jgi:hypothetical protein
LKKPGTVPLIIKPVHKTEIMKKLILIGAILITLASCGNAGADTSVNPSDTTGKEINPALEDPNSNMADTMHMVDSTRVKDTSIKDNTSLKPKKH